ncbi:MAG: hypothetical protein ACLQVM_18910 [Terriglobia bacterium]
MGDHLAVPRRRHPPVPIAGAIGIGSSKPFALLSGRKYAVNMKLDGIKQAIADLPETERTSLVAWLNELDAKAWDEQIKDDFSDGGAGMALLEKWDAEIKAGKSVPLEEFLAQREKAHKA